jgi:flagellar motor protein MotB
MLRWIRNESLAMKKLLCLFALLAAMAPLSQANATPHQATASSAATVNLTVPSGTLHQIRDYRDMRHAPPRREMRRPPHRRFVRCRDGAVRRYAGECRRHGGVRRYR